MSLVSVLFPNTTVDTYSFVSLVTNSTILVALPIATISTPSAIGSNVPVCPTFFIPNNLLIVLTTSNEVIPFSLFTAISPLKSVKYSSKVKLLL